MSNMFDRINESANFIKSKSDIQPKIGLILGSGLGVLGDEIESGSGITKESKSRKSKFEKRI